MFYVFFPKRFEFAKFVFSLRTLGHKILDIFIVDANAFRFIVQRKESALSIEFHCIVANASDVEFSNIIHEYIHKASDHDAGFGRENYFVLMGTTGFMNDDGLEPLGGEVGNAIYVSRAVKFDRGTLKDVPDCVAFVRKTDAEPCVSQVSDDFVRSMKSLRVIERAETVFSSNMMIISKQLFLDLSQFRKGCVEKPTLHSTYVRTTGMIEERPLQCLRVASVEGTIAWKEVNLSIDTMSSTDTTYVDMETYEFFLLCKMHRVNCIGAVRVLSDSCGDPMGGIHRATVEFDKGTSLLMNIFDAFSPFVPRDAGSEERHRVNSLYSDCADCLLEKLREKENGIEGIRDAMVVVRCHVDRSVQKLLDAEKIKGHRDLIRKTQNALYPKEPKEDPEKGTKEEAKEKTTNLVRFEVKEVKQCLDEANDVIFPEKFDGLVKQLFETTEKIFASKEPVDIGKNRKELDGTVCEIDEILAEEYASKNEVYAELTRKRTGELVTEVSIPVGELGVVANDSDKKSIVHRLGEWCLTYSLLEKGLFRANGKLLLLEEK